MISEGPTSHSYISQRTRLHYVDWGNPEAPPLVLVHGNRDHCRNWDWVAQALRHDYHIIAPDLRGHGDSAWTNDGEYPPTSFVYDLAQLIHQLDLGPINLVGHSLGGNVCLRYAGLYPENIRRLAVIEGLGLPPEAMKKLAIKSMAEKTRDWIDAKRAIAGRLPKRYPNLEEAFQRMKEANGYLSDEQARHLTIHGVSRNEDGSYSWKFDNYVRILSPSRLSEIETVDLWKSITCPTLLLYGKDSWASNPEEDGRINHFSNAKLAVYENAGHWLHHDRTDQFIADIRDLLEN